MITIESIIFECTLEVEGIKDDLEFFLDFAFFNTNKNPSSLLESYLNLDTDEEFFIDQVSYYNMTLLL